MNKRISLTMLLTTIFISMWGQESTIDTEAYISDETISKCIKLPLVRNVYGGTKIIVTYTGDWTNEMIGAFEYACRIWEEALPTSFPIRIDAVLDNSRTATQMSKISFNVRSHTDDGMNYPAFTNVSTWTQMKGCTFAEMAGYYDTEIYDGVLSLPMFENADFKITYYNKGNKLKDNCSFSLTEDIEADKYDFVTLVLRDIAKAFGIEWNNKNVVNEQFRINTDNIIPYEKCILDALEYNGDAHQAYLNALNGNVTITDRTMSGPSWNVYSPQVWEKTRSLNYFIPSESQKITQLLSYDFGRGTVIRDIASYDTYSFFRNILRWKGDIAIGVSGTANENHVSTSDCLPYNSTIRLANIGNVSKLKNYGEEYSTTVVKYKNMMNNSNSELLSSLYKYHPNLHSDGDAEHQGWSVSVLKNDGSWDIIFDVNLYVTDIEINPTDLNFHYPAEEYARSCDGYLRCRISKAEPYKYGIRKSSYYYMMDFLPPKVRMKKSAVLPCGNETDYYREVKIGLNNIEGVDRIVVSQLDEGEEMPTIYEVPDFKKGYFIASVDRECESKFTITAYNKNGSTKSDEYVLKPLSTLKPNWNLDIKYDNLILSDKNKLFDRVSDAITDIRITMVQPYSSMQTKSIANVELDEDRIDISQYENGIYELRIKDKFEDFYSWKFVVDK